MRNRFSLALAVACAFAPSILISAPSSAQSAARLELPSQPLDSALRALGNQTKTNILFDPESVRNLASPAVTDAANVEEALAKLLVGSGLTYRFIDARTVTLIPVDVALATKTSFAMPKNSLDRIHLAQASSAPQGEGRGDVEKGLAWDQKPGDADQFSPKTTKIDEITVTGTRIRGAQPSSPLVLITQEEMRLAGHNNLGDVIRALPQNFGGPNPGVLIGAGGDSANQNVTGGSSLNLRGLGPDATLTLLNGARLPYDGVMQTTDVAVIPVAAIERFEVLLDGASAIYGSDAVGGVANVVLKRDYKGAELSARYGEATDGGYEQTQVSAIVGTTWASGGLLIAGETTSSGAVLAEQRDYLEYISRPDLLMINPKLSQDGVLISGHQELGSRAELVLDAFYTKRSMTSGILTTSFTQNNTETAIYGISPSLRIALPNDWSMRIRGFSGEDETKTYVPLYSLATGAQTSVSSAMFQNQAESAGAELEGALFALPGGEARLSFGGGWRKTRLAYNNLVTGRAFLPESSDSGHSAYGEIYLPLIDEAKGIPFVNSLALNGAVRYEKSDRFDGTTTPKIGAIWKVAPSLDIRASWGKSFKVPTLADQNNPTTVGLRATASLGVPDPSGTGTVLQVIGGNPDLAPERAEVVTAGFVIRPSFLPGASIELGWFDIDYTQRVVQPFQLPVAQYGQTLSDPAYASFITLNPTPGQQEEFIQSAGTFSNASGAAYDPQNVIAIFDNRRTNAASQVVRGIDLDVRYAVPALGGLWSFSAGGSWITHGHRTLIDLTPAFDTAGVVAFPPKFKGRMGANWSRSSFSLAATVNRLDGVRDTRVTPGTKGDSMTTLDLVLDYAADPDYLKGFGFNLAVTNVFNQRPPFMEPALPYYVNYDSINYSALGRVIGVTLTKRF